MREIRTSGSTRGSGRKALLRKCHLSLSTLPCICGCNIRLIVKWEFYQKKSYFGIIKCRYARKATG